MIIGIVVGAALEWTVKRMDNLKVNNINLEILEVKKPCKFCNNNKLVVIESDGLYQVKCPVCDECVGQWSNTRKAAIKAWRDDQKIDYVYGW